jgi:ribonuclease Z
VAYVTDTAPCAGSFELARDVDLLIHEATYADELHGMAVDRKHSTIRQAATIAREAGARMFAATHFSTRYEGPAFEQLREEGRSVYPELVMAKDLMRVTLP